MLTEQAKITKIYKRKPQSSKAHYNEGDSVPYRAVMDDLETGHTYSIRIQWDTVDSGAYAIDYLTGFNFSFEGTKHPGEPDVTPTVGINDLSSGYDHFDRRNSSDPSFSPASAPSSA